MWKIFYACVPQVEKFLFLMMWRLCPNCDKYHSNGGKKCEKCHWILQPNLDFATIYQSFIWSSILYDLNYIKSDIGMETMISWLPSIRPYKSKEKIGERSFIYQVYLVSHLLFIASSSSVCWGKT
eukprot:UN14606